MSLLTLALETSGAACAVAVARGKTWLASHHQPMARGQAEALPLMVDAALAEVGVSFAMLDQVVVTVGPGSFTGIRVGLSYARALGLALDRPVLGVDSMVAAAACVPEPWEGDVAVALDTRRGMAFLQNFAPGLTPRDAVTVGHPDTEASAWRRVGNAWPEGVAVAGPGPSAMGLLRALDQGVPVLPPVPLYLAAPLLGGAKV